MTVLRLALTLAAALALSLPVTPARADAAAFLESLQGKWRGSGTVRTPRGRQVRARCGLTNSWADNLRRLTLSGRCASTQGARAVRGSLTASKDGDAISGSAFGSVAGARVVSTSSRYSRNRITITSRVVDTRVGRTARTRTVITGGRSRFTANVSVDEGSGFKRAGTLTFRR